MCEFLRICLAQSLEQSVKEMVLILYAFAEYPKKQSFIASLENEHRISTINPTDNDYS